MKTMKRLISAMLTLLLIFGMSSILPVMAVEETEEWILSEAQVIQAVQPLTTALAEYYDIGPLEVRYISQITNEDNTVDLECRIIYPMCLKADKAEDLPYVSGMLARSGYESINECTVLPPPLNKFILNMPRKLSPKRITTSPEITFTAPLYSCRKLPMVPAIAPIATKITVNPLTNPNAPDKVFFVLRCPPPAK